MLAHLVGWDYTNIDAVNDIRAGKPPRVIEHWDPGWVKYNAELVRRYKPDSWVELLEAIRQSHQALIERVGTVPAEDIEKDFGLRSPNGTNVTVEWFLQAEIDDEGKHYQQIQEWLK